MKETYWKYLLNILTTSCFRIVLPNPRNHFCRNFLSSRCLRQQIQLSSQISTFHKCIDTHLWDVITFYVASSLQTRNFPRALSGAELQFNTTCAEPWERVQQSMCDVIWLMKTFSRPLCKTTWRPDLSEEGPFWDRQNVQLCSDLPREIPDITSSCGQHGLCDSFPGLTINHESAKVRSHFLQWLQEILSDAEEKTRKKQNQTHLWKSKFFFFFFPSWLTFWRCSSKHQRTRTIKVLLLELPPHNGENAGCLTH